MNKKSIKKVLGGATVLGAVLLLTSCNSFCSNLDTSNYMYGYNGVNTTYFDSVEQGENFILDTFKAQANVNVDEINDRGTELLRVQNNASDLNDDSLYIKEDGTKNPDLFFYKVNENVWALKNVTISMRGISTAEGADSNTYTSYTFGLNDFTKNLISTASSYGMIVPTSRYWEALDQKTLEMMVEEAPNAGVSSLENVSLETLTYEEIYGYTSEQLAEYKKDTSNETLLNEMLEGGKNNIGRNNALLARTGFVKYHNDENPNDHFATLKARNNEIITENKFGFDEGLSVNFLNLMQTNLNSQIANLRTCITVNDGYYGHTSNDPLNDTVLIEGKGENFYEGWGRAFSEHGFLEGLLVYPIGTMVENFAHIFGMNGYGQICAVLLATFIIRILFMLVTMPATLSQQKMSFLQPELAKLQQKYPNANTNNYEKQKMAQAQMALYKKYKVHPFSSLLVIIVQFPVFICVWNALQGSASLSRDAVLGLRLSDTIWNVLSNFTNWPSNPGWWTALVLIILMSAAQIVSMLYLNGSIKREWKMSQN